MSGSELFSELGVVRSDMDDRDVEDKTGDEA